MRNRIISLTETTLSVRRARIYDWTAGKHDGNTGTRENDHMDALSDVLRVANLTGGVFLHAEFRAPWCIVLVSFFWMSRPPAWIRNRGDLSGN